MPLGSDELDIAKDPPDPDPEPPPDPEESDLAVTPEHPLKITTDATRTIAKRYLRPFANSDLWSRAGMDIVPFVNRELPLSGLIAFYVFC